MSKREADLRARMQALSVAEAEIERRMTAMEEAERRLRETLAVAKTAAEDDVAQLTQVYATMKPKQAAALFEEMEPDFAAGFLGRMRPDAAAAIMAGLDFHTIFIKASESRELLRSTLDRRGLIARFIFLHGITTLRESGLREHEAILQAFLAGDQDGVLACLDRMAARLIALCDAEAMAGADLDRLQKD